MSEIENVSDQLSGFAEEVARCVKDIEKLGFTKDQAIKITEIACKDIMNDVLWRRLKYIDNLEVDISGGLEICNTEE